MVGIVDRRNKSQEFAEINIWSRHKSGKLAFVRLFDSDDDTIIGLLVGGVLVGGVAGG